MNLVNKCSLDYKSLLDKKSLIDNEINVFIKAKILSGECDDTFYRIQEKHPMIPFILLSALASQDLVATEAYEESEICYYNDELLKALNAVFDATKADLVYNYLIAEHLDLCAYEVTETAYLYMPYGEQKHHYINMLDDGLEVDEYNATYGHYFKDEYIDYLYDYWIGYLKKNKDILWEEIQKKLDELSQLQENNELIF